MLSDKCLKAQIAEFALRVHQRAPHADAMLISCGGLRTLNITAHIEREIRRPVISSNTAGIWSAVRLVGHSGKSTGFGRLFEMDAHPTL
jgi:arylmalonate decarboxylase